MSPWIELQGEDRRALELPEIGTLILGASPERASFVIAGQGVDEAHCAIGRTKDGDWAIKDLGSRHGTLVNGQRVSAVRLGVGDEIVLGSRRLGIRAEKPDSGPAAGRSVPPPRVTGYRIERLIGRGGMGTVWLSVQESLRRPVALKVLAPKLAADSDFVHRFQAEARAAAALSHANVVVVYDVGADAGTHYLSMEYMAGGSLEQKLSSAGPLPWKTVLSVLSDAAAGLAYAESRGIVHRDIKPANLMYSGTGTVKIADLGLATTVEQEASEAEGGRKVYGTPHFISPEQARGEAVDHRSDLYSLGATAYRLLTGHTPFEGDSTRDILRALQSEEPRPLREHVPDLPDDLEGLVTRLMAKAPQGRFPSAEALRRECDRLRLLAEHGPTLELQASSRAQRWIGLLLVLVVLASSAWYFLGRPPAQDPSGGDPGSLAAAEPEHPDGADDPSFFASPESGPAPTNEERALRERERSARFEFDSVSPLLDADDLRAALAGVATRWSETEAGREARARLNEMDRAAAEARAAPAAPDPLAAELAQARKAAGWPAPEGVRPQIGRALAAVRAHAPSPLLAEAFEPARTKLRDEIAAAGARAVEQTFAEAEARGQTGDFEAVRRLLSELEPLLEGLELPDDASEAEQALSALEARWRARREGVAEDERAWLERIERADRIALARALGPASGLLEELVAADFGAVEARLAALPALLRERPLARLLATESAQARAALQALAREFRAGNWRRKSVLDPRTRRVREVRDVHASGLVFDDDDDAEPEPWSRAGGDPEWWDKLFQARVQSDWDETAARGIASLLRLEGAAHAASLGRKALDPRQAGLLQPAELEALTQAFAPARTWQSTVPDQGGGDDFAALAREEISAQLLARAIEAAQGNQWSRAAADLERCLAEGDGTLLLGLVSEGSAWHAATPESPLPEPSGTESGDPGGDH